MHTCTLIKSTKHKSSLCIREIKIKYDIQYFNFFGNHISGIEHLDRTQMLLMKEPVTPFLLQMASNVQQLFEDFHIQANI